MPSNFDSFLINGIEVLFLHLLPVSTFILFTGSNYFPWIFSFSLATERRVRNFNYQKVWTEKKFGQTAHRKFFAEIHKNGGKFFSVEILKNCRRKFWFRYFLTSDIFRSYFVSYMSITKSNGNLCLWKYSIFKMNDFKGKPKISVVRSFGEMHGDFFLFYYNKI